MSEQIGKHKGAVETLLHEQKELSRILQIVNSQLERHLKALEEAGVDTDQFIIEFQEQSQRRQQAQQEQQKQAQKRQRKQQPQNNPRNNRQSSNQKNQSSSNEDERDMEDYFEEDDDEGIGDRDFSPR